MTFEIILVAIVLILCIAADKFSGKFGMPALILFIGIGMLFGYDGIAGIEFDNFKATEYICNIALGFIMFYGGKGNLTVYLWCAFNSSIYSIILFFRVKVSICRKLSCGCGHIGNRCGKCLCDIKT